MHYFDELENDNSAVVKAIVFHAILVAIVATSSQFMEFGELDLNLDEEPEVISSAVRIDVVAMPKLTLQELKKVDAIEAKPLEEEPKEESPANETSKVEFKKEEKKINVNNLLKDFSQKNVVKKIPKKKDKEIDKSALRKIILEGNKVSQGSSTTGESIDQANQAFVSYMQGLPDKVRPNWKLPSYLMGTNLRCRVRIFLDANGNIIKTQIFESSGEPEFDAKALEALKQSSPLPRPSKEFLSKAIGGAIILGFPL